MTENPAQAFLQQIEGFLTRTKMPATVFGRSALKDPSFVRDLRRGRAPNLRIVDRVNRFMRDNDVADADRETAA